MDDEGSNTEASLPEDLLEAVRALDEEELRTLIDFAHRRIQAVHPAISEQIEESERQEVIQINKEHGLAKVLRREPAGDTQDKGDVPILYVVTEERTLEGETTLHWTYLGPVRD